MKANDTRTLDDRLRHARQTLALVSVVLTAVADNLERQPDGDDALYHASERGADLAAEALADLDAIDLPRPCMEWHPDMTDKELLARLQEYARGGRPILRKAAAVGGGVR